MSGDCSLIATPPRVFETFYPEHAVQMSGDCSLIATPSRVYETFYLGHAVQMSGDCSLIATPSRVFATFYPGHAVQMSGDVLEFPTPGLQQKGGSGFDGRQCMQGVYSDEQVHTALGQLLLLKSCHRAHILKWELSMSIQTVQVAASHLMPLGAHLGMG
eukprot:966927-Pelagomonas_calceolata.AAC.6